MNPNQRKRRVVIIGSFLFGATMWTGLMFGQHGDLPAGLLVGLGVVAGISWAAPVIGIVWYLGKVGPTAFWGRDRPS